MIWAPWKGRQTDLKLERNCQPPYCEALQVPYTLRAKIEAGLTRLEKEGILNKVEHIEWATPATLYLWSNEMAQYEYVVISKSLLI
jgi:acyl-CoA-binding protein